MNTQTEKITVVGAGLVGSLLSAYLAKHGFKVEVFEKRADYRNAGALGGRSINLALSDRGWQALEDIGAADEIREIAIPMNGRIMHNKDKTLTFQAYGKEGQAIFSVSRGELNTKLIDIADKSELVNFHFEHSCEDVNLEAGTLHFTNAEGTQVEASGDLIVGTDGAFSAVRSAMQKTNRFNYSQHYIPHGYKELTIPPGENGSFLMEKNALHIWPRRSYMLIALPNLDGSFTCTLFMPFEGEYAAFEALDSDEKVMDFFKEEFPDAVPLMPTLTEDFRNNPTSSLVTVRCSPWTYGDNFLIMGDASHAIVPFYGQGMNSGFEDCFVFNQFLEGFNGNRSELIKGFEKSRIPNANAIADLALHNFIEMRDSVADPKFLLQKKIEAELHRRYPDRWVPLYTMVTFRPDIPYSEAIRRGKEQHKVMQEVVHREGIEENWESIDFEAVVNRLEEVR